MDSIVRDIRFAGRLLVRKPGFAVLAVLTLALGIGASTAVFTVFHHVLLQPLPFESPDELVFLHETSLDGSETYSVSLPNFRDWRERNRTFRALSSYRAASFNVTGGDEPLRMRGAMVSANFFETLGASPHLGTVFALDEELSVVLSHRAWRNRFGGRRDVLGEVVVLDDESFVIRGVMPEEFEFLSSSVEMWVPLGVFRDELPWDDRGSHPALWVVGRLGPGVSLARAREDMDRIAREIDAEYDHRDRIALTPLHERAVRRSRGSLVSLMGAVGLLLLLACVNVANLVLARSSGRSREMATRRALGADRRRLTGQLLVENLLLSLLGGLLGLLVASWGIELLKWLLPDTTPRVATLELNVTALLFAVAVSVLAGVGFGLVPLVQRSPSLRALMGLRSGARGVLVVAEVALASTLLLGAGLLVKSFVHLSTLDAGFETSNRVAVRFDLTPSRYGTTDRAISFYRELLENVRSLPGVRTAAVSTGLPLVDPGTETGILREGLVPAPENFVLASFQMVSTDYFETLGVRLVAGRVFDDADRAGARRVVVVDETLAETVFPGESALGKRFFLDGTRDNPGLVTIVGIVEHVRNYQLSSPQYIQVYMPLRQPPSWTSQGLPPASLVVRLWDPGPAPLAVLGAIRNAVARIDPLEPIYGATTLVAIKDEALTSERANGILASGFAFAALGLAALGLYGVLSSIVAQRTSEIGLRIALGATPIALARSVVRDAVALVALGLVLGLVGGALSVRLVSSVVKGVSTFDPAVVVSTIGLLLLVAAIACAVPTRRAIRLTAVDALRHE